MRAAQLQAALIRKRDAEQIKVEKSAAVDRYFDRWGKITTRFENWTCPEYYNKIEEDFQKEQKIKAKKECLEGRREKLRLLYAADKEKYNLELQDFYRPKHKKIPTDILDGINRNLKDAQSERRRCQLEAQLYSSWRYGMTPDREKILLESKNTSHAMAKLNWLDKQVENHLQQEQDKKESEERQLRLQEEQRKHEAFVTQCRMLRDSEIKELRSLQENNVTEVKTRELESNELRTRENYLREKLEEIQIEYNKLELNSQNRQARSKMPLNQRRIKMFLKQRSEEIRKDLMQDIILLNKISNEMNNHDDKIVYLKQKFQQQYDIELKKLSEIEAMYESEAKSSLFKQEELWTQESDSRENQLKTLLVERINELEKHIQDSIYQQKSIVNIKENHLKALENSNDRLKELINEQRYEIKNNINGTMTGGDREILSDIMNDVKLNNKNNHIKTDDDKLEPPKFGRKKVAWC